jgi:tellurite resistance protein TehA-like permease
VAAHAAVYAFTFGMQTMPLANRQTDRGIRLIMKIAVWVVFGIVTLVWTAGTFIAVKLTQWGTTLLASGNIDPLSRGVAEWPLPQGLPLWLDPAMIQMLQQYVLLSLEAMRDALPYMSMMMGWLVPLIWAVWGFGLVFLVALAGGAHWLMSQQTPARI